MDLGTSAFFQELVESADELFSSVTPEGRFRYVSPSARTIFGIEPEKCINKKALSLIHREDRRSVLETIRRCAEAGETGASFLTRVRRRSGALRHLVWTVKLKYDRDGTLMRINAIGRDITQRKNAEEKLRRSKEMWNNLFMASPTWIALATVEEGIFLDFNDAFCRDTGYRKEEVIGRTSNEIGLWPNESDRAYALTLIKKNGHIDRLPVLLKMKNGDIRDFLWSTVIIDVQNRKCLLSVLVDVTDLKRSEKELARMNQELQSRSEKLSDMNAALKILLNQREEDKKELEVRVWHNIKNMIQPHLNNLKVTRLSPEQNAHLNVAVNRLNEIASGIGERLGYNMYNLSARELEVAGHIMEGKPNKEIAEVLNISVHSVESHRFSIRKKLGIQGNRANLRTHLFSLSQKFEKKPGLA